MALRKEQVLLLGVLAIALLQYKSMGAGETRPLKLNPKLKPYAAQAVPHAPEIGPPAQHRSKRDPFWEPSETQPLPPRQLPFPDRPPLTIVPPPLSPGRDLGHAEVLRMSGDVVEGVTIAAAEPGAAAAPTPAPQEPEGKGWERWVHYYDQIWIKDLKTPFLGELILEGKDKFKLEEQKDFSGETVKFRRFNVTKGQLLDIMTADNVDHIVLRKTLRNDVERRVRTVPENLGHNADREKLIDWLLARAREEAWVYGEALRQADISLKANDNDLDSLRLKVRVLRQKGDLPAEFELFHDLAGRYAESAFRYEGLGLIEARLGLPEDAERDLRKAVDKGLGDPRPLASLASFLLAHGRVDEALRFATKAATGIAMVTAPADQAAVIAAVASCRLAVGDVAGARAIINGGDPAVLSLLPGAVDYADPAADPQTALQEFRQAGTTGGGPPALFGAGACLLRLGQWQDAQAAFDATADQAPLLRDSAYAAKGLVYLKIGQRDVALQWLDRALEADPQDVYALYLRGRVLRELGLLPQALEALQQALHLRDDFLHAVAEVALVHEKMAEGPEAAVHLAAAARYADRLVALETQPSREFLELQGTLQFEAGDLKSAETAFNAAIAAAPDEQGQLYSRAGLALCEYAHGRTDEARTLLQRLAESLPIEHPMRKYAEETRLLIDDHSEKERLEDRFERPGPDLGAIWSTEGEGMAAKLDDNRLVFRGHLAKTGEYWAERTGVLPKGRNFLALSVHMQLGPAHRRENSFAGLRLQLGAAKAPQPDFKAELGLMDGKPYLKILDGRAVESKDKEKEREPVRGFEGKIPDFQALGDQVLEFRVVPRETPNTPAASSQQFVLQCSWNGVLVHERPIATLNRGTTTELHTMLEVTGTKDSEVDVRFDDFQLERRKDK